MTTITKQITRTIAGVQLFKQSDKVAREAGAESLWLTADFRFELRGDNTVEFGADRSEIEWGVWDRNDRGGEGDWADGGRGNGVESFRAGAEMIARVLADEEAAAPPAPAPVVKQSFRPAALAHIGTVADQQAKVIGKINELMRLASNCIDFTDDSLKKGTNTQAVVLIDELLVEFTDLRRADFIRLIESKGLDVPDSAR